MIISWNVRGLAYHVESFLSRLSSEVDWDFSILQEFSGSLKADSGTHWPTREGHLVFQQAPCQGRKMGAIIVQAKNSIFVVEDSFLWR